MARDPDMQLGAVSPRLPTPRSSTDSLDLSRPTSSSSMKNSREGPLPTSSSTTSRGGQSQLLVANQGLGGGNEDTNGNGSKPAPVLSAIGTSKHVYSKISTRAPSWSRRAKGLKYIPPRQLSDLYTILPSVSRDKLLGGLFAADEEGSIGSLSFPDYNKLSPAGPASPLPARSAARFAPTLRRSDLKVRAEEGTCLR